MNELGASLRLQSRLLQMPNTIIINSIEELAPVADQVRASARQSTLVLADLLKSIEGVDLFWKLRFENAGRDPLDPNRPLNFVEQLNQTSSYLVTIAAAAYLFDHHKSSAPFVLTLGPIGGHDIASSDGKIVAETFAATRPGSNNKLNKEIKKLSSASADHKYVFYFCPSYPRRVAQADGVTTVSLGTI